MTAIRLRGVGKEFDRLRVLEDLDLEVRTGEFLAIIGRSGSGKSTLLRLVAGLERPTTGVVEVAGPLAVAFQEPRLLPWLSVLDNVAFGLRGRDATRRALGALDEVGLADRSDAWPLSLSGGQAQRVSLARALVRAPRLLLLDEPLGALDALTRIDMQNLIGQLWNAHGFTVVMVTHDVHEAIRLADRVVVVDGGRVGEPVVVPGRGPRRPDDPVDAPFAAELLRRLDVVHPATELEPTA